MSIINISPEHITGRCEYKCDYKFDYTGLTDFSMMNNNNGILQFSLNQSNAATAPVKYNGTDYQLININVSSPSMHQFSSYTADAEIVLIHQNVANAYFIVCIPVIAHATASQSDFLSQSVENLQAMTTTSSTFSLSNYNLNTMIPMDPYYTYNSSSGVTIHWLVFGRPSALTISQQNLNTMTGICGTMTSNWVNMYQPDASGAIYFNNAGPRHLRMDDNEIYIDCKPTDSKGNVETEPGIKGTSTTSNFNSTIFNTSGFQQFTLYLLLFLFVLGMFYVFYAIPTFFISLSGKPQPVAGPVVTNPGT